MRVMAENHPNRSGYSDSTSIIAIDTLNTRRCRRSVNQRRRAVPNVTQTVTLGAFTSANSRASNTTACMPPPVGKYAVMAPIAMIHALGLTH